MAPRRGIDAVNAWVDRTRAPDQRERFGGIPPGAPNGGAIASQAPFQRLVYPPRIEKLQSSQDFSVTDFAMALGAGAGTVATSANLRFVLPASMVGWLQYFALYVLSQSALTSASWAVRINGGPVSGFEAMQNPPGVANLVLREFNDLRVRLGMNAVVDVAITNLNANGPWTVGGQLAGWYHTQADEDRVFGDLY